MTKIDSRDLGKKLYVAVQHRNINKVSDKEADGLIGRDLGDVLDQWTDGSKPDGQEWHQANDILGRAYPLTKSDLATAQAKITELEQEIKNMPQDTSGAEKKLDAIREALGIK